MSLLSGPRIRKAGEENSRESGDTGVSKKAGGRGYCDRFAILRVACARWADSGFPINWEACWKGSVFCACQVYFACASYDAGDSCVSAREVTEVGICNYVVGVW